MPFVVLVEVAKGDADLNNASNGFLGCMDSMEINE
jgi:hypothetical protein